MKKNAKSGFKQDYDNLPALITIMDFEGNLLFINKEVAGIYNFDQKANLHLKDFFPDFNTKLFNGFVAHVSQKKAVEGSFAVKNKGKGKKIFAYKCKVVNEGGSEQILSMAIDITERSLKEKQEMEFSSRISELNFRRLHKTLVELSAAKKTVEESIKGKEIFMANVSHEIRTPLTAILGFSQLLKNTQLTEEQKKYFDAINYSAQTLSAIVNNVLDFSKIEAEKMTFEYTGFSLKKLLDELINIFTPRIQEKKMQLEYFISEEVGDTITADETRLNQILLNLISNAVKFTRSGKILIKVEMDRKVANGSRMMYTVKDSGIGIKKEKLETIFDPFVQAEDSITRKYGGTGLGLSIVKKLVELQDGEIEVKSEEGKGSEFIFYLPVISENTSQTKSDQKNNSKNENYSALRGKKILIVEDHELNRLLIEQYLNVFQATYYFANDGEEAILKLAEPEFNVDVIFMDIQLPGKNGHETTKYLRNKHNVTVPIIALTANAFPEERERCFESGMNDYLKKPFLIEELYATLTKNLKISNESAFDIDLTSLRNYTNNNSGFMLEILKAFSIQTPPLLENLNLAHNKEDFDTIRKIAHKLLPSVTLLGVNEIRPYLETLNSKELQNTEPDMVQKAINAVTKVCNETVSVAQGYIEREHLSNNTL